MRQLMWLLGVAVLAGGLGPGATSANPPPAFDADDNHGWAEPYDTSLPARLATATWCEAPPSVPDPFPDGDPEDFDALAVFWGYENWAAYTGTLDVEPVIISPAVLSGP